MTGRRGGLAGAAAALLLLLLPASAAACPTTTRFVTRHKVKFAESTCTDNFRQPAPCPDAGQSVTQWADEGISKRAVSIKPRLTFPGGGCPNATVSGIKFIMGATKNPDGTPTNPKPGEQIEQVVWTENGTGPGGQTPDVRVTVAYEDAVIKPLKIEKFATSDKKPRQHVTHAAVGESIGYYIEVTNPNATPATVHVRDRLPSGFISSSAGFLGGQCEVAEGVVSCDLVIKPRKTRIVFVFGKFKAPGKWVNVATAKGSSDGAPLPEVKAKVTLRVG